MADGVIPFERPDGSAAELRWTDAGQVLTAVPTILDIGPCGQSSAM